eukprot:m.113982 g.113982  ORF g.113982 m.113982 type:complete len:1045 (+) comp9147_c0_seq2:36-3170(+)
MDPADEALRQQLQRLATSTQRLLTESPPAGDSSDYARPGYAEGTDDDERELPGAGGRYGEARDIRSNQVVYGLVGGRQVPMRLNGPLGAQARYSMAARLDSFRWPADLDMILPSPTHIIKPPRGREPFAPPPSAAPPLPQPLGEERVVYDAGTIDSHWFVKDCVRGGDPDSTVTLEPLYTPVGPADATLQFEARFESGNLHRVTQTGPYSYALELRTDLYTSRHTQWYYFRVSNMRPGPTYRFSIINFLKSDSLYNYGMQPCVYSDTRAAKEDLGWHRGGHTIAYRKGTRPVPSQPDACFYVLTWSFEFPHAGDTVYFAYCVPYTYTNLMADLDAIAADPGRSACCRQRALCTTLCGNMCPLLTVTTFGASAEDMARRKGVVITARVHPGETVGSWMMRGLIDFLTGPSLDAKVLRDNFVFKLIPMLNPDGVIVGNYRCSLAGVDLNRTYRRPLRDLYPTVAMTKTMMHRFARDRPIALYCDLHGHSRKQNVFMYGCLNKSNPTLHMHERIFPLMLHKNIPEMFSYRGSQFNLHKSKESTGRITIFRELGIVNSFTMEATFCGASIGPCKNMQFTTADFERMGPALCDTILDYCDPDPTKVTLLLQALRHDVINPKAQQDEGEDSESVDDSSSSDEETNETQLLLNITTPRQLNRIQSELPGSRSMPAPHASAEEPKRRKKKKKRVQSAAPAVPERRDADSATVQPDTTPAARTREPPAVYSAGSQRTRSSTGIPVYAEERMAERARRRQQSIERMIAEEAEVGEAPASDGGVYSVAGIPGPMTRALRPPIGDTDSDLDVIEDEDLLDDEILDAYVPVGGDPVPLSRGIPIAPSMISLPRSFSAGLRRNNLPARESRNASARTLPIVVRPTVFDPTAVEIIGRSSFGQPQAPAAAPVPTPVAPAPSMVSASAGPAPPPVPPAAQPQPPQFSALPPQQSSPHITGSSLIEATLALLQREVYHSGRFQARPPLGPIAAASRGPPESRDPRDGVPEGPKQRTRALVAVGCSPAEPDDGLYLAGLPPVRTRGPVRARGRRADEETGSS